MPEFFSEYIGQLAGVGTSLCWSFTSIFFTLAGRRVGSPVVNRTRLVMALIMVSGLHWVLEGQPLPLDAAPDRWLWFALSGFIGFVLGDAFLFQAFVMIGPRLSMLLMSLNPVMGALLALAFLGETLSLVEVGGMALALAGVMWVVSERRGRAEEAVAQAPGVAAPVPVEVPPQTMAAAPASATSPRLYLVGVLFALGGALGQASGFVLSSKGLEGDFPALSGNLMRLIVATLSIWVIALAQGHAAPTVRALQRQPRALRTIFAGAVAGPFVGVTLSLIAVQNAPVGIASTLAGLAPIFLIPLSYVVFRERITPRAIGGTLLAVTGTALLFLA